MVLSVCVSICLEMNWQPVQSVPHLLKIWIDSKTPVNNRISDLDNGWIKHLYHINKVKKLFLNKICHELYTTRVIYLTKSHCGTSLTAFSTHLTMHEDLANKTQDEVKEIGAHMIDNFQI